MNTNRPANPFSPTHQPSPAATDSLPSLPGGARLLSLGWLLAMVIFALAVAGLLIPRQGELVKRLVEDGRHHRALVLVGEGVPGGTDGASVAPSPANLATIILDSIEQDFDDASQARIETLVRVTDDPAGVHRVLREKHRIIPSRLLPGWLEKLAVRALQVGKPAVAVTIYDDLSRLHSLDLEQTRSWVSACRFAGQPGKALEVISAYLDENQVPFSQLPDDLRSLTIDLNRELNQGSHAFDLLSREFSNTLDTARRKDLVTLITTVAAQSQRVPDSLPILQAYLAETSAGRLTWQEIAARPDAARFDPEFRRFAGMLAQNLEWNQRSEEAFDVYRKLAAMGDVEALDRCVTIYPWIDRQEAITGLLEALVPVVGRDRYTLLLSRLLAEQGRFRESETIYRAELAGRRAEEGATWAELAGVIDAQGRFVEALHTYQTALELSPERHLDRIKVARLQVTLGRFEEALESYRSLPEEAHDRKTREDFAMLAKSLDRPGEHLRVLEMQSKAGARIDPGLFLDMADAAEALDDDDRIEIVLRKGLETFPASARLELHLADYLARTDRRSEAFDHLAEHYRDQDKRYASRLLNLGSETGRISETLALTGSAQQDWSPSERFDLATLLEASGNRSAALEQYRKAEGGASEAARLEAELAHARGDLGGAIRGQERFVSLLEEPDHEAWLFLGDLYRAASRTREAEAAYRAALEHLKQELARQIRDEGEESPEVAIGAERQLPAPELQPRPSS